MNHIPNCPTCGGGMWDNRPKKRAGEFSPKSPDFKCKDKDCGGVVWHEGDEQSPAADLAEQARFNAASMLPYKSNGGKPDQDGMMKCNASNVAKDLIIAGKVELDDFETIYRRVLEALRS